MKKFFFSLSFMLLVLLLVSNVFSAFKSTENTLVYFYITASVSNNVNTGDFISTGFESSSGTLIEEYAFNGKKAHSEVTFTFADGTVTAKTHSDITITSASTASGTGRWTITKGTGAYAGVKGSGTLSLAVADIATEYENISQEWTGSIK